jgi:hypothetical protein
MSNSERAGFVIVAAVFVYTGVWLLFTWSSALVAAMNRQQIVDWPGEILKAVTVLLLLCTWGRDLLAGTRDGALAWGSGLGDCGGAAVDTEYSVDYESVSSLREA